jgi:haloacid dehalogenase-like hydrolase
VCWLQKGGRNAETHSARRTQPPIHPAGRHRNHRRRLILTLRECAGPDARSTASWNDGPAKQAILDFVRAIGQVPPEDRIVTFDQDGTLWVEHPVYTQAMFALERLHTLAPQHPEWKDREPFKAVLANDEAAIAKFSERDWAEIVFVTHAGMSQAEFLKIVTDWLATAKHPRFKRPYTELVYRPMLEVMNYLRTNGFRTYIVTGGDLGHAAGARIEHGRRPSTS